MFENVSLVVLVPVVIGAVGIVIILFGLFRGSKHPNHLVVALLLAAALCGSSVFSTISWESNKGKIETVAGVARKAGELTAGTADVLIALSAAVTKLEETVAVIQTQLAPSQTLSPTGSYVFPKTGFWQDFGTSSFCASNPSVCSEITATGSTVNVPKGSYEAFVSYSGTIGSDLTRAETLMVRNEELLKDLNTGLDKLPPAQ